MQSTVQSLLAALKVERAAIDRAIDGLQQMSEVLGATVRAATPKKTARRPAQRQRRKPKRTGRAAFVHLTPEQRAQIATEMAHPVRGVTANALAKEFGVSNQAIHNAYTAYRRTNGAAAPEASA